MKSILSFIYLTLLIFIGLNAKTLLRNKSKVQSTKTLEKSQVQTREEAESQERLEELSNMNSSEESLQYF